MMHTVQQEEGPKKEKTLWPLHEPVSFQHEMDFEVAEAPGPPSRTADIRWSARVGDANCLHDIRGRLHFWPGSIWVICIIDATF